MLRLKIRVSHFSCKLAYKYLNVRKQGEVVKRNRDGPSLVLCVKQNPNRIKDDFIYRDSYERKIACQSTNVGWVLPNVPCHAQTCPNLSRVTLIGPDAV